MAQNASYRKYLLQSLIQPFRRFVATESLASRLLLFSTVIALVWANSPWADLYFELWHIPISIQIGNFILSESLLHWINDGLMAVFFLVIGLEIKRELLVGELSSIRKAALPMIAALGGMIIPAIIYSLFNAGGTGAPGWGIPMATDIAFAVGILAVLGKRIPTSLKVFLLALAIVDDMGAILVIALFYTADLSLHSLLIALAILIILAILNAVGVKKISPYLFLGVFLWLAVLESGVHATIAGVLLAFVIPARSRLGAEDFIYETGGVINEFPEREFDIMTVDEEQRRAVKRLESAVKNIQSPLQRLEDKLHPFASLFIIPVFALANAGVTFKVESLAASLTAPIFLGVVLGLFLGKQIGITFFSWLGVKLGLANLPSGVNWSQIYGLGLLGGIGFTMSLFVTNLAFVENLLIEEAKVGILAGSLLSAAAGLLILIAVTRNTDEKEGENNEM